MDTDRQIVTLNCEISTAWERKSKARPKKTSGMLMGDEQVTRHKTLQAQY